VVALDGNGDLMDRFYVFEPLDRAGVDVEILCRAVQLMAGDLGSGLGLVVAFGWSCRCHGRRVRRHRVPVIERHRRTRMTTAMPDGSGTRRYRHCYTD